MTAGTGKDPVNGRPKAIFHGKRKIKTRQVKEQLFRPLFISIDENISPDVYSTEPYFRASERMRDYYGQFKDGCAKDLALRLQFMTTQELLDEYVAIELEQENSNIPPGLSTKQISQRVDEAWKHPTLQRSWEGKKPYQYIWQSGDLYQEFSDLQMSIYPQINRYAHYPEFLEGMAAMLNDLIEFFPSPGIASARDFLTHRAYLVLGDFFANLFEQVFRGNQHYMKAIQYYISCATGHAASHQLADLHDYFVESIVVATAKLWIAQHGFRSRDDMKKFIQSVVDKFIDCVQRGHAPQPLIDMRAHPADGRVISFQLHLTRSFARTSMLPLPNVFTMHDVFNAATGKIDGDPTSHEDLIYNRPCFDYKRVKTTIDFARGRSSKWEIFLDKSIVWFDDMVRF